MFALFCFLQIAFCMLHVTSFHLTQTSTRLVSQHRGLILKGGQNTENFEVFSDKEILLRSLKPATSILFTALASCLINVKNVNAKVYFDTDVYGDKELKIATVNKIKQKLRNAILQDISVAPDLLKLAINDALGFDASTDSGGPDGSIVFEIDREENKGLEKALAVVLAVKKDLQRTNTVSLADVVAFGGAEALETVGAGRITVQVGRFDSKNANPDAKLLNWYSPQKEAVLTAFSSSGLDNREMTLLLGAVGEIQRVVQETLEAEKIKKDETDEDDEEFESQPFVPTTFGARDAIYGAKMGKGDFGVKYLKEILKNRSAGDSFKAVLTEEVPVRAFVSKYAANEPAFLKEVAEVYLKLTLLGEAYTTRNS